MRVLDTDVCVEILRGNAAVLTRRIDVEGPVTTTWITAGELYYGAAKSPAPVRNQLLVGEFLATLEVLGLDHPAAMRFGALKSELERRGNRLADADLLIAAITVCRGGILATGNTRHYSRIEGLATEDWIRGG